MSRVFAVLLLAWTSADLCGGMCPHDREPIATPVADGRHGPASVSAPSSPAGDGAADTNGPDDCFCCSHYVDVQVRFAFEPTSQVIATLPADPISHPRIAPARHYHPPLA